MITAPLPLNMRRKIRFEQLSPAVAGPCWVWTACKNSRGYGCVAVNGKSQLAHRVAYELLVGPIPEGLQIDHLCRIKACCNPEHLEAVTGTVNIRRTPGVHKDFCVRGHAMVGHNLMIKKRGKRSAVRNCRACAADYQRARRQRAKASTEAAS